MVAAASATAESRGRRLWRYSWLTLSAACAIYCGLVYAYLFGFGAFAWMPIGLFGFYVSIAGWFVVTLVHELGHLIAALIVGWRPVVFVVRPIGLRLMSPSIAWVRRDPLRRGGWVGAIPRRPQQLTQRARAIFTAGGPVASVALAAAGGIAALAGWGGPGVPVLAGVVALQSLWIGVATLVPATRGGTTTDGDKLRAIRRERGDQTPHLALLYLALLHQYGVRLRDYPQWLIDAARAPEASAAVVQYLDGVAVGQALDRGAVDAGQARRLIDAYRAAYGESAWRASCDAYLAVVWERDVVHARQVRWTGAVTDLERPMVLAADAAIEARLGGATATGQAIRAMRTIRRKQSRFRDDMFRDIERQIDGVLRAAIHEKGAGHEKGASVAAGASVDRS